MNEQERSELESLKRHQARLDQELALLSSQLQGLERRLSRTSEPAAASATETAPQKPAIVSPQPVPPVIAEISAMPQPGQGSASAATKGQATGSGAAAPVGVA